MFDWFAIGGLAVKATIPMVAKEIIARINSQLNPTELEMAIKEGIKAAQVEEEERLQQGLFLFCDDKQIDTFLAQAFKNLAVQGELEKPLKDEKLPDTQILAEAFKLVAAQHNIKLNQVGLESWLRTFTGIYFQKTPAYPKYKAAKKNYLEQIIINSEKIHFAGIKVRGQDVDKSESLKDIFVIPDVREENQNTQNNSSLNTENISPAGKLLSYAPSSKIVILGEPGSGKSTLMQYFAVKVAQKEFSELELPEQDILPILIRIRDLAKQPEINILAYLQKFIPLKFTIDIPEGFFDYWFKQGKALILLDGLDEIADENRRRKVVEHFYSFVKNEHYAENKVIVTSRPVEYKRDFFRTKEFPHYDILPFDEQKIDLFIQKWHDSRSLDKQDSERGQTSLKNVLKEQERIKLLVKNPLLLTLICLVHRYDVYRLPQNRYKLYEAAVGTLLVSWETNRYDTGQEPIYSKLKHLDSDDLQRLMEQLAYWIHDQESEADKNCSTIVKRDEIIEKLSKDIKNLNKQIELYQAEQEAEKLIDYIRERSGLLNEQGQDCYAFVHKTFQEYLCAREINYQRENEDNFQIVLDHIEENLYKPHWREVLLLLIVIQKPKPAAKAIKAILDKDKDNEELYHHNLLFAASCLAEDPKDLKTAVDKVDPDKNDPSPEILKKLVELETNPDLDEKIRSELFSVFCNLSQTDFAQSALKILEDNHSNIDEQRMQQYRDKLEK